MPYFKSMLILGSIRSVCVTNLLRNSMLQCIFAHSSWLLHHARAALSERSAQHCSSWVPFILDSNWLQICCTSIFSKWKKKSQIKKIILMLIFFCKIPSCFSNSYPNQFIPNTKNHLCKVNKVLEDYNLANPKEFLCSKIAIVHAC